MYSEIANWIVCNKQVVATLLVGLLGVLISIYFGWKAKKNTELQTYQRLELESIALFRFEADHPNICSWLLSDHAVPIDEMPIQDQVELTAYITQLLNLFEMAVKYRNKNIFPSDAFASWVQWLFDTCDSPFFRKNWVSFRLNYTKDLRDILDEGILSIDDSNQRELTDAERQVSFFKTVAKKFTKKLCLVQCPDKEILEWITEGKSKGVYRAQHLNAQIDGGNIVVPTHQQPAVDPCNTLHFLANMYRCRGEIRYLNNIDSLRQLCLDAVAKSGLNVVGDVFHQFDGGGVTGAVVLSESHLAIHTWPEIRCTTVDVYVSNHTRDNNGRAKALMEDLVNMFNPEDCIRHEVPRGERFVREMLSKDYWYFLRSDKQISKLQTVYQTLEVHETALFGRVLRLDGHLQTSEKDEFIYHENLIQPALTALDNPKKILIIGGGDGGAAEEALKHPTVERVVVVEIDEKVVEAAKTNFFAIHRGAFSDMRLELIIGDGSMYVTETKELFDHIALDLTDFIGVAKPLYEEKFFHDCKKLLAPGGLLTLHIGSPAINPDQVRQLCKRLRNTFTIVRPYVVFVPLYGSLWAMAACSNTFDPVVISAEEIDERIQLRKLSRLGYYNGATHHAVFALPNFVRTLVMD